MVPVYEMSSKKLPPTFSTFGAQMRIPFTPTIFRTKAYLAQSLKLARTGKNLEIRNLDIRIKIRSISIRSYPRSRLLYSCRENALKVRLDPESRTVDPPATTNSRPHP